MTSVNPWQSKCTHPKEDRQTWDGYVILNGTKYEYKACKSCIKNREYLAYMLRALAAKSSTNTLGLYSEDEYVETDKP